MKRIDLHIHTIATSKDAAFDFSMSKLKEYVNQGLDAIAITNHNYFDVKQYNEIAKNVSCNVFPGVEVDLEGGHILVIAESSDATDFETKCSKLTYLNVNQSESLTFDEFSAIFTDFNKYLFVPHYKKDPVIRDDTIKKFGKHIVSGEVSNPKKFRVQHKDRSSLTPVIFSDSRISDSLVALPLNQTYVQLEDISLKALKYVLSDRTKISLSADYSELFNILDNGTKASDGLNVILGKRSSGKTYTLKRINEVFTNIKYIKQFSLLELNEDESEKRFKDKISKNESKITEEYLTEFREVCNDASIIDLAKNENVLTQYIESLHNAANYEQKADIYSKTRMFNETEYTIAPDDQLDSIISAVTSLLDNESYKTTIEKFISRENMIELLIELINKKESKCFESLLKTETNTVIQNIKRLLVSKSSTPQIKSIDLLQIYSDFHKIERFNQIVQNIKKTTVIHKQDLYGFTISVSTRPINSASDLRTISRKQVGEFSGQFSLYNEAFKYLKNLSLKLSIAQTDVYKYFVFIECKILNKHGFEVSGGERSEFNLINELDDAYKYDLLLINEPESSFDNIFIKENVNDMIKDISEKMPVFVVTHSNTVGASIKPDYILYTEKTIDTKTGKAEFEIYGGHATDKKLKSVTGKEIENYTVLIDSLEAGEEAYKERGEIYENIKN